jgi:hypothetical protein
MFQDDSLTPIRHVASGVAAAPRGGLSQMPPVLQSFLWILVAMVALCFSVELICHSVLHLHYPYSWPLMFRHPSFFDFEAYFDQFHRLHTPSFFEGQYLMMYPAPVVVCYWFFYMFQPVATAVFISFALLSSLVGAVLVGRALVRAGMALRPTVLLVGATYLLAYPFWFEFKQGNMEILVWIALSLALLAFSKEHHLTAAGLIGVAGAMKFYPIIYLGLLIPKKRYRECVFGCLVAGCTLLASLWFVGPTISTAWHGTQAGLAQSQSDYLLVLRPNEMGFDHSLFGLVKYLIAMVHRGHFSPQQYSHFRPVLLSSYMVVVAMSGVILYFLRIRFLPVANQLLCLCVASILFPPMSFDYTLVHLYAPWTLLALLAIAGQRAGVKVRGLLPTFLLLGLCVSPLGEFIFRHDRFGGEVRAVLLLLLFTCGLLFPFMLAKRDGARVLASTRA